MVYVPIPQKHPIIMVGQTSLCPSSARDLTLTLFISSTYTMGSITRGVVALICPVCKSDMIVIEYRSIELDYCTACNGVWFDTGELELLLNSYHIQDIKPFMDEIAGSPSAASKEKERKCPICGRGMKKKDIGKPSGVLIDACGRGHGLWFDGGEVIQLLEQMAVEQPAAADSRGEVIKFMWEVFQPPE